MKARSASAIWIPTRSTDLQVVARREKAVGAVLLAALAVLVVMGLDVPYMADKIPTLVATVPLVLVIALWGTLLACSVGLLVALAGLSQRPMFYTSSKLFISLFQGVPLIVILFLLYFGLPHLNPDFMLTSIQAGIIGLGLCNAAFLAEVFRSSILAVPPGQTEAARAIGMDYRQTMWRIVLPQAARIALPPTSNYYIFILKDSALVGFIGVAELFFTARSMGQRDFQVLEMLVLAGGIYWVITIALSAVQRRLEQRMEVAYTRDT